MRETDTYTETIRGCREENRTAQTAFYHRFAPELYIVASRLLNDYAEAEEVVQEVMLHALSNPQSLLPLPLEMERRLRRMTVNASISHLRKNRRITWETWDEKTDLRTDDHLDELLQQEKRRALLDKAFNALPTQGRTVLQMAVLEEMEEDEIARQLHITASCVRAHISIAKKKLIKWFKHENR